MTQEKSAETTINDGSQTSLAEANRSRAEFSGHGKSKGAAGYREMADNPDSPYLSQTGQTAVMNQPEGGFNTIKIGAAWDNILVQNAGLLNKLLKKATKQGVDIDLGCLYELEDGSRGCVQAFGEMLGAYDQSPFISLSGDERTGDAAGEDEFIRINGTHWNDVKRLLVYVYIYRGGANWADIKPMIKLSVKGEIPMIVVPDVQMSELAVCAVAMVENVRGGIRLTNHTEYFPGHAEMDRAFGFGLEWADGSK